MGPLRGRCAPGRKVKTKIQKRLKKKKKVQIQVQMAKNFVKKKLKNQNITVSSQNAEHEAAKKPRCLIIPGKTKCAGYMQRVHCIHHKAATIYQPSL